MGWSLPRAVSDRDPDLGGRLPAAAGANRHLRKPKVKNAKLDARTARARLGPRRKPYWHALAAGCAVGYRRAAGPGRG
jgi:hypothetical protein